MEMSDIVVTRKCHLNGQRVFKVVFLTSKIVENEKERECENSHLEHAE